MHYLQKAHLSSDIKLIDLAEITVSVCRQETYLDRRLKSI